MLVSVVILIVVSIFLALGLYLAEVRVNPDFGYGDALLWNFVKYVDDPAEMTSAPVTLLGKIHTGGTDKRRHLCGACRLGGLGLDRRDGRDSP